MADTEMERALRQPLRKPHFELFPSLCERQPLRKPHFELFPSLCENAESSSIVFGPLTPVHDETDRTVMMLLAVDREEIVAGRSFTQCDRIKESNCIHHSQYIQLLRELKHNHLLDSSESNVEKRLVDIKPYVLLLQRLPSKLVQYYPKNANTRDQHLCPYDFLKTLGTDLLNTKPIVQTELLDTKQLVVRPEDPSDDMGLYVTGDLDMYIDNIQQVVDMLQRRV